MRDPGFPPVVLARARKVRRGQCVLCGCTEARACVDLLSPCWWEPGTKERLCSAHTDIEKEQARAALRAADREAAKSAGARR